MITRAHAKQLALIVNEMRPPHSLSSKPEMEWRKGRNAIKDQIIPTKWCDMFDIICPEFDRTRGDRA